LAGYLINTARGDIIVDAKRPPPPAASIGFDATIISSFVVPHRGMPVYYNILRLLIAVTMIYCGYSAREWFFGKGYFCFSVSKTQEVVFDICLILNILYLNSYDS
jgi:hypothetical protein